MPESATTLEIGAADLPPSVRPEADGPPVGAWRTVTLLTFIYLVGTLDRSIASLLAPVIKTDLRLTDVEVSLIQGLAFGLFFMIASPLMGWLVDRYDRRAILFGGLSVWSIGAISSGIARTFGGLFVARAVVGGCEASINPTAYAMLSKLFPAKRLALPMSIFVLGGNLGTGLSFLLGGAVVAWVATLPPIVLPSIGHLAGWQVAFIVTGLPGLLFAPMIWTAVDDRSAADRKRDPTTFADLWTHIRQHPRFVVTHHLGFAMVMAYIVGLQSWTAAYLSRMHGWSIGSIGLWMGISQLAGPILGLALHGWMVDRLFARGRSDAHLIYFAIMSALALPCGAFAYLVSSGSLTLILYSLGYFLMMAFASIGPAALQIATPPSLRGKASAVYMVVLSILATILAPFVVALLTDHVFADESKLGYSLALFAAGTSILAIILFLAGRPAMRRAVAEVQALTALQRG